jgi:hypothetical protein
VLLKWTGAFAVLTDSDRMLVLTYSSGSSSAVPLTLRKPVLAAGLGGVVRTVGSGGTVLAACLEDEALTTDSGRSGMLVTPTKPAVLLGAIRPGLGVTPKSMSMKMSVEVLFE